MIIMMKFISIILLILSAYCENQQKFVYISNETVTIEASNLLQISLSLTTKSDEYLSQAIIQAVLDINQISSTNYNLLFFNYQNAAGQQCYSNWVMNSTQLECTDCSTYAFSQGNLPDCMNFTNCYNEDIKFTLHLSEELYKESFIIIQNTSNTTELILQTQIKMELSSENTWFYWGVGLTCLLLISLVIYAGIIFYWMLKYKKIKKMFEQFKLTEEEESIKKEN